VWYNFTDVSEEYTASIFRVEFEIFSITGFGSSGAEF
jgi:hypothetical protein